MRALRVVSWEIGRFFMELEKIVEQKYKYIAKYIKDQGYHWRGRAKYITGHEAAEFFIGVMLDQQVKVSRNNCAACHLVYHNADLYMKGTDEKHWQNSFWENIANMDVRKLNRACYFSDDMEENCSDCEIYQEHQYTGSYAQLNVNKFPVWLKSNAKKIIKEYQGHVEYIWEYERPRTQEEFKDNVNECTERFTEFDGIGKALANMAVFILVRDYGLLGGKKQEII